MSYTRTEVKILLLIFCLALIPETSNCAEENDLWLLISSHEGERRNEHAQ